MHIIGPEEGEEGEAGAGAGADVGEQDSCRFCFRNEVGAAKSYLVGSAIYVL